MAFKKTKSRKCPVCVGFTAQKVVEIDKALQPVLAYVRESGEVPKPRTKHFNDIATATGVAPFSLHYHVKNCLVDMEIQDQRVQELRDMTEIVSTAKAEYLGNPTMQNGQALSALMTQFRGLASDIEGQQDPNAAVEFIVETVLGPLARRTLASVSEELRSLRESIAGLMAKNHTTFIHSQINGSVQRISSGIAEAMDDGLKNLCEYYSVEFEASDRKRAMETVKTDGSTPVARGSKSQGDDTIH